MLHRENDSIERLVSRHRVVDHDLGHEIAQRALNVFDGLGSFGDADRPPSSAIAAGRLL